MSLKVVLCLKVVFVFEGGFGENETAQEAENIEEAEFLEVDEAHEAMLSLTYLSHIRQNC